MSLEITERQISFCSRHLPHSRTWIPKILSKSQIPAVVRMFSSSQGDVGLRLRAEAILLLRRNTSSVFLSLSLSPSPPPPTHTLLKAKDNFIGGWECLSQSLSLVPT